MKLLAWVAVVTLLAGLQDVFYTPGTFGGDRPKAIERIKKAIEIVAACGLAHIRLVPSAQVEGSK